MMLPAPRRLLPLLALALLAPLLLRAQPGTDQQLAAEYMRQGDYQKAVLYYEKLYRQEPSTLYYEQLLKGYLGLKQYGDAEKLAKEQLRRQDDPGVLVDLGMVHEQAGDSSKAGQQYEKALKQLKPDQASIRNIANAFARNNRPAWALRTYERGRKLLKDGSAAFFYETANLRASMGDVGGMVSDYMDLLAAQPGYLQAVQNGLARFIDFTSTDDRSDILRTELLRRIQKEPDNTLFPEMLIWLYIQQKDLAGALVQSKAMDKRFKENGQRLMALGDIAVTNKDWAAARKCYEYVLSLGADKPWYGAARTAAVNALDAEVRDQADPPREQLENLRQQYGAALAELGRTPATWKLISGLARLKAYYLNDDAGAAQDLQQAIAMPGLGAQDQARLKLELGDILVLGGHIWDASLLYSQVDLDFKQDVLGHEARLRNAKVSYYAGDFRWAKAKLDVLKASTSKLIANDAMELSLLISDNLGTDSVSPALSLFAQAQLLAFQHRFDSAVAVLDTLAARFPMGSLSDDVLYARYRIAYGRHQFTDAAALLVKVVEQHPNEILADNAMYDLGRLYEDVLKDPEQAMNWYGKLLFEQSGSIFVPDARERYRRLRGDHDKLDTPEQQFLNGRTP